MNQKRMLRKWREACAEIKTGHVAVPEDFLSIQQFVDRGGNPWRLNPVETARRVGVAHLGFTINDTFTFQSYYVDFGSGLNHALVRATHGPCHFVIDLYQPVRQGRTGIWAVQWVTQPG